MQVGKVIVALNRTFIKMVKCMDRMIKIYLCKTPGRPVKAESVCNKELPTQNLAKPW